MNHADYASIAAQIADLIEDQYGIKIRWTQELYIDRETGEWMVFRKVDDSGHEFPRVLHRLGSSGNLEFRSFSR